MSGERRVAEAEAEALRLARQRAESAKDRAEQERDSLRVTVQELQGRVRDADAQAEERRLALSQAETLQRAKVNASDQ